MPAATTRVAAVIGDPVRHSLSPAIHEAAFAAAGLDWTFVAFEVRPEGLGEAVAGVRGLGIEGLSVTMPHKEAIGQFLDDLTPAARDLDAVNCVFRDGGTLVGDNTDGAGLVASLRERQVEVVGRRVAVLGAGGAARAVIRSLAAEGASEVVVVNRSADRGRRAVALAGPVGVLGGPERVGDVDLVVNATPVGMGDDPSLPIDPELLHVGQVVADLVYHPLRTALLAAAADRGCECVDGVGMLVGQAALSFERWTGRAAPVEAMRRGAMEALGAAG
jgi:shikimate dehydrogenase